MAGKRASLASAHPSLSILLPHLSTSPDEDVEPNPLEKKLNAATEVLLEGYTRDIISAVDKRTAAEQVTKLVERMAPTGQLTFGLLPQPCPCKDYFKIFHGDEGRGIYTTMRILTICAVAQALKGIASTFVVLEIVSIAGNKVHSIQYFKWRFRAGAWLVFAIQVWRGLSIVDPPPGDPNTVDLT